MAHSKSEISAWFFLYDLNTEKKLKKRPVRILYAHRSLFFVQRFNLHCCHYCCCCSAATGNASASAAASVCCCLCLLLLLFCFLSFNNCCGLFYQRYQRKHLRRTPLDLIPSAFPHTHTAKERERLTHT